MKGFVFIYGSEIILRFLASGAFESLDSQYDLTYVVLRSGDLLSESDVYRFLKPGVHKVEWVSFYPERFKQWNEQFDISCILYQDRSPSFAVRYQERSKIEPERFAALAERARPGIYEQQRNAVEEELGLHPDLLDLTLRERPDFFLLPSALIDYLTDDVLQIADKLEIPTLMLVAGWDNLSSKGLLYHQPTVMGVWGEQSKQHAIEVQGTDAGRIQVVGAPHYESYYPSPRIEREAVCAQLGVPATVPLVLFAGTFRLFDETQLLREIESAIEAGTLPRMHILYRPHPWRDSRQHEDSFFDHTWRHVTMDAEMAAAYNSGKSAKKSSAPDNFMQRLEHLVQLYTVVDALISPMSTVLLEALLFGLPTMAVAFSDGKHSWSADKVSQMLHFKELYDIPGLLVCRERADFFTQLSELIQRVGDEEFRQSLRQSTNFFVYRDRQSYAERVVMLTGQMLAEVERKPLYDTAKVRAGKRYRVQNLAQELAQRNAVARTGLRVIQSIRQRISR